MPAPPLMVSSTVRVLMSSPLLFSPTKPLMTSLPEPPFTVSEFTVSVNTIGGVVPVLGVVFALVVA